MHFRLSFFFVLLFSAGHAQYENMLHKTFAEKLPLLVEYYQNTLKIHDTSFHGKETVIEGLREFGKQHHDESLVAEAALAAAWLQSLQSPDGQLETSAMQEFIEDRTNKKDMVSAARAWRMLGDLYLQKNNDYETTLECYFKNIETGNGLSEDIYPERMYDFFSIGNIYYQFKEYRQALYNLRQALMYRPPHTRAVVQSNIRNTLGLCYQKTGNLDSSDYYFNQVLQHETDRHEEWKGIAMGNLGYNYFLRGNYPKAIAMLDEDIAIATKYHAREYSCKSFIWLATIYLRQNNMAKAAEMAREAERAIVTKDLFDYYEFLYPLLSKLYAANGNFAKSEAFLDSALWAKDSVERKFDAMQLARAEQKAESVKRRQQLASLELEKKNKTLQRNILIGFLIFLMFTGLYIYRLIQRRHKQEQLVKDLELEKKETALSTAQQQLKDFSENFQQKALLLEQLESQLQAKGTADNELLEQLRQSTLLTDEQWTAFRQVFDKVHGGYLIRLKDKLPDLTPAEIRYMALAKLRFSNKEMASALGISQQTVRVTVHRLRKKLSMPEEGSLSELVESI